MTNTAQTLTNNALTVSSVPCDTESDKINQRGWVELPISNRPGVFALVDSEDAERCQFFKWHLQGTRGFEYPSIAVRGKRIRLHHFVLGIAPKQGQPVDHINGNTLDNRKSNLRICSRADNQHNRRKTKKPCTSQFKGVHQAKEGRRRWIAKIKAEGKFRHLGSFLTEVEAARSYDAAAVNFFGEFASLNFPDASKGAA